jgi:hypothetical protein
MLVLAMRLLILNACCAILKAVVNPIYWKKQENGLQPGTALLAMYICVLAYFSGVDQSHTALFLSPRQ